MAGRFAALRCSSKQPGCPVTKSTELAAEQAPIHHSFLDIEESNRFNFSLNRFDTVVMILLADILTIKLYALFIVIGEIQYYDSYPSMY